MKITLGVSAWTGRFAVGVATAYLTSLGHVAAEPLMGFTERTSEEQLRIEDQLDESINVDDLKEWMRKLAAHPHHVGSAHGKHNAEFMRGLLAEFGYEAKIETFHVLIPYPTTRTLRMTHPELYEAALAEEPLVEDVSTLDWDDLLPPYNAYSPDGQVHGELVYVNYGRHEDFEHLERIGVSVEGKITIARYGRIWRGLKSKNSAVHGAIGCILYSDPADDGYARGVTYPEGGYKHNSAVQRGSIMDMTLHGGDLLTPGWAATQNSKRLSREEAPAMATIPTLPISYADALPLLRAMKGPVVPDEWRGALPFTYRVGPGSATVELEVRFDWRMVEARNVIAKLEGSTFPDQWVMRGNHHDAWAQGAHDPTSGIVSMLAEAKAVASAATRPKRTVVYAAWDAEEFGMMGSTEWVEHHLNELRQKLVVYINTDSLGRGYVRIGGSPTLELFVREVLGDVPDPQSGVSLAARSKARIEAVGSPSQVSAMHRAGGLRLRTLGAGSDYVAFLQHLGVATASVSSGGETESGSYHTAYDTFTHFERFVDPGYEYGAAVAKLNSRMVLRLSNADLLPFDFTLLHYSIRDYVTEIVEYSDARREEQVRAIMRRRAGSPEILRDPRQPIETPDSTIPVPHFNFAPLENAVDEMEEEVALLTLPPDFDVPTVEQVNELLRTVERLMTTETGLRGRPWYRHQLYAPSTRAGYGAVALPEIREAIDDGRYEDVDGAIADAATVIQSLTSRIREIRKVTAN